jgi:hypothetical protein
MTYEVDQCFRPLRDKAEDDLLRAAGYKSENHPRQLFLSDLLTVKAELHRAHQVSLSEYLPNRPVSLA